MTARRGTSKATNRATKRNQARKSPSTKKAKSATRGKTADIAEMLISKAKGVKKDDIELLRKALRKGPKSFSELCDALDRSPKGTRAIIVAARDANIEVKIHDEIVGIEMPSTTTATVEESGIAPTVGETQRIAVISDTHFGSRYCMRPQIQDFVEYAYSQGVKHVLHPGDLLDGCYNHGKFELTHFGLEDQARDAAESLPWHKDLSYHAITGNHDETFWADSGVNVGRSIEAEFREHGREDIKFYGDRGAYLDILGVVIEMWHPRGGGAYARSYRLQKHIEGYTGIKPQIVLTGHFHQYCHVFERGVQGLLCPTFQGSGSKFSRSLGGSQAHGGLILEWDLTEHNTIRNFAIKPRYYYEKERPVRIYNNLDATAVSPQVTESAAAKVPKKRGRRK